VVRLFGGVLRDLKAAEFAARVLLDLAKHQERNIDPLRVEALINAISQVQLATP
jgi:hypothetical protein